MLGRNGFAVKEKTKGPCALVEERCITHSIICEIGKPCPVQETTKQCCALSFACQMQQYHSGYADEPSTEDLQECMANAIPSGSGGNEVYDCCALTCPEDPASDLNCCLQGDICFMVCRDPIVCRAKGGGGGSTVEESCHSCNEDGTLCTAQLCDGFSQEDCIGGCFWY